MNNSLQPERDCFDQSDITKVDDKPVKYPLFDKVLSLVAC